MNFVFTAPKRLVEMLAHSRSRLGMIGAEQAWITAGEPGVLGPEASCRDGRSLPFAARNDRSGAGRRHVSHVTDDSRKSHPWHHPKRRPGSDVSPDVFIQRNAV